jgi:hypothetical protein
MKIGENRKIDSPSYTTGFLIGTIKGILEFGNINDMEFKLLAGSLISCLDPDNVYDFKYALKIKQLAENRGIHLNVEF